jgi:ribosomal protein L11 methyltransferase
MAFGTGMHASTQLCLGFIDDLFQNGAKKLSTALDVGTGTGILGLSAALLGCPQVIGIDNDVDARVAAAENIEKNGLADKMRVVDLDLAELTDQFDLVIANIIHNTLIELAEPLTARVAEHGFLVLAGILSGQQVENILKTYCALGLKLVKEKRKEEWSALCLVKG